MLAPKLADADVQLLRDQLAAALEEMIRLSCPEMASLWYEATRAARAPLGHDGSAELEFAPSARYLNLSKPARSKYRGLAAWRHAVIWREVRRLMEDPDHRAAMDALYFEPYPRNTPPYAWSAGASESPAVSRFPSATTLKHLAKEGCWTAVALLRRMRAEHLARPSLLDEVLAGLLRVATRETLRDELKLEDFPPWPE